MSIQHVLPVIAIIALWQVEQLCFFSPHSIFIMLVAAVVTSALFDSRLPATFNGTSVCPSAPVVTKP